MRTSYVQLPSYQELCDIIAVMPSRAIPQEKEAVHYGDFSTIVNLLKSYDLSTTLFEESMRFDDLKDPSVFDAVSGVFDDLVHSILRTQDDPVQREYFNDLYDYLSEEDELLPADLIFVFGSKMTLRTQKAVRLYKQGYAQKILISGKGPLYEQGKEEVSEAETLARYAIDEGVPREALILEKESMSVPDNVKRSLNLLEEHSMPHQSIILVNSPFSQRRGWAHWSKLSDQGTKLIRSNIDTVSEKFSKDGWYRNEEGAKVIVKEFFGLKVSTMINVL